MAVIISKRIVAPMLARRASDYGIGESIFLIENNNPIEYIIVNQGNPNTDIYDASCDGTWVLRKNIIEDSQWSGGNMNTIQGSTIVNRLGTILTTFGESSRLAIKSVKVPYQNGGYFGLQIKESGLASYLFLLCCYEMGITQTFNTKIPIDGTRLSFFEDGTSSSANNKRVASGGSTNNYWTRSPQLENSNNVWYISSSGYTGINSANATYGIRPCAIIDFKTKFDTNTNIIL